MTQGQHIVTIVGGSGFVGRYVVKHLARAGYRIRVVARSPEAALRLKTAADPGQIALVAGDITRPETLAEAVEGAWAVVSLAGILFENKSQTFTALHTTGPEQLAKMSKAAGVQHFVHLSALGVDKAFGSEYARSKLMGEKAVLAAFPGATILRPGVIFGAEDRFFNQFASMPILPLIGGGNTRFQPVYVDDVAAVVAACLLRPDTKGETFELAGVASYSFRALLDFVQQTLRSRKLRIRVPFSVAMLMGLKWEILYRFLPLRRPLITRDQVRILKYDNVLSPGAKTFAHFGIIPQPLELIVPSYLARYNPRKVV